MIREAIILPDWHSGSLKLLFIIALWFETDCKNRVFKRYVKYNIARYFQTCQVF